MATDTERKKSRGKKKRERKISNPALRVLLGRQFFGADGILGNGEPAAQKMDEAAVKRACDFYAQAWKDCIGFVEEYVNANGPEDLKGYIGERLYRDFFKHHRGGWIARLLTLGVKIPASSKRWLDDLFVEMRVKLPDVKVAAQNKEEAKYDKQKPKSFSPELKQMNVDLIVRPKFTTAATVKTLTDYIKKQAVDVAYLREFKRNIDAQVENFDEKFELEMLKKTYPSAGIAEMFLKTKKSSNTYHHKIVEALESVIGGAPKSEVEKAPTGHKTRKKKEKSVDQIAKKAKFLDKADGVTSLPPEKLIGASEAWIYSSTNRMLRHLVAAEGKTLTIEGTKIKNFDDSKSKQKKVRKPKETLQEIVKSPKKVAEKVLADLNVTEYGIKDKHARCGASIVIVKVF